MYRYYNDIYYAGRIVDDRNCKTFQTNEINRYKITVNTAMILWYYFTLYFYLEFDF